MKNLPTALVTFRPSALLALYDFIISWMLFALVWGTSRNRDSLMARTHHISVI